MPDPEAQTNQEYSGVESREGVAEEFNAFIAHLQGPAGEPGSGIQLNSAGCISFGHNSAQSSSPTNLV